MLRFKREAKATKAASKKDEMILKKYLARERRMALLWLCARRQRTTIQRVLKADFGEYPPKGIDPVVTPKQWVRLRPLRRSITDFKFDTTCLGLAVSKHGHTIFAKLATKRSKAGTNGHEATHILQHSHVGEIDYLLPAEPSDLRHTAEKFWVSVGIPLEKYPAEETKNWTKEQYIAYQKQGVEIQAHLHECLASGYQFWNCLPGSRKEFFAAMIVSGVDVPEKILGELQETKSGRQLLETFSKDFPDYTLSGAKAINIAQSVIPTEEGKIQFWNDVLLTGYGNLLEMYGDGPGRARLGLGKNALLATSWAGILRGQEHSFTENDYNCWAQALDPKERERVAKNILLARQRHKKPNDKTVLRSLCLAQKDPEFVIEDARSIDFLDEEKIPPKGAYCSISIQTNDRGAPCSMTKSYYEEGVLVLTYNQSYRPAFGTEYALLEHDSGKPPEFPLPTHAGLTITPPEWEWNSTEADLWEGDHHFTDTHVCQTQEGRDRCAMRCEALLQRWEELDRATEGEKTAYFWDGLKISSEKFARMSNHEILQDSLHEELVGFDVFKNVKSRPEMPAVKSFQAAPET